MSSLHAQLSRQPTLQWPITTCNAPLTVMLCRTSSIARFISVDFRSAALYKQETEPIDIEHTTTLSALLSHYPSTHTKLIITSLPTDDSLCTQSVSNLLKTDDCWNTPKCVSDWAPRTPLGTSPRHYSARQGTPLGDSVTQCLWLFDSPALRFANWRLDWGGVGEDNAPRI